jgi:hypothetical protein
MKTNKNLLLSITLLSAINIISQNNIKETKYRRSSLELILIESESFPKKESVMKAWNNYPFPDKYNKHDVNSSTLNPLKYIISDEDRLQSGKKNDSKFSSMAKGSASKATSGVVDTDESDMPLKIDKYIKENNLAKKIVAKWFNRKPNGDMDYELIKERGNYSASEKDKEIANNVADATDFLFDEDLIGNTFIVFSKLKFVENEPIARAIRDAALSKTKDMKVEAAKQKAVDVANSVYEKAKEGYSVWTTSWLYQLEWNQLISENFKSSFLNSNVKGAAIWDTTSLFKLKLVGSEKSQSLVTFSLKEKRTEDQIINLAVVRNVDNVFAKLQSSYAVFRPVTPIASVGPITAQIGLKEGLMPGNSFEILESQKDKKTGQYKYVKIGSVKVDKKLTVWDNRFGAVESESSVDEKGNPIVLPKYTTFSGGGKDVFPGMHFLRLKK